MPEHEFQEDIEERQWYVVLLAASSLCTKIYCMYLFSGGLLTVLATYMSIVSYILIQNVWKNFNPSQNAAIIRARNLKYTD